MPYIMKPRPADQVVIRQAASILSTSLTVYPLNGQLLDAQVLTLIPGTGNGPSTFVVVGVTVIGSTTVICLPLSASVDAESVYAP